MEKKWREAHVQPNYRLQIARSCASENEDSYQIYADEINNQNKNLMTLRVCLIQQPRPNIYRRSRAWTEIVKRFKTGAMSYGSISQEAHENLAVAMTVLAEKATLVKVGNIKTVLSKEKNGDWKNSAIKQVASGRFGVTSNYLTSAKEIQIKKAQGAKPGEVRTITGRKSIALDC